MTAWRALAARESVDDCVELIEVADLEGEDTLLAETAQGEIDLETECLLETLFQRLRVGTLACAGGGAAGTASSGAAGLGVGLGLGFTGEAFEIAHGEFL